MVKQVNNYIIALTNLYGIVDRDKVLEVYNSQNKDKISNFDLDVYFDDSKEVLEENCIDTYKTYFVNVTIMESGDFDIMLKKQSEKPFYLPSKDQLIKYADDIYFEKNKEYKALVDYIKENFFYGDREKAEHLAREVQAISKYAFDIQLIMDSFNLHGIVFENVGQANKLAELIMYVSHNVRLWENNGFTSKELSDIPSNYKETYSYKD